MQQFITYLAGPLLIAPFFPFLEQPNYFFSFFCLLWKFCLCLPFHSRFSELFSFFQLHTNIALKVILFLKNLKRDFYFFFDWVLTRPDTVW